MSYYSSFGTLLKLSGVTVAGVRDVSGPNLSLGTADVTNHSSPSAWAEKVGTIKDAGEVTFDIVFDPVHATHKNAAGGLLYLLDQRTVGSFTITFPDTGATVWTLPALVTGFTPTAPVEDSLTASVTLTVSGAPTLA